MVRTTDVHDWEELRKLIVQSRGSPIARERLQAILGVQHGNDQVAWHEAARRLLRADVEAVLREHGALDAAMSDMFDREKIAFFSLDPVDELRRAAFAIEDRSLRAKIERAAAVLAPQPQLELEDIIPEQRLWVGDSECIDDASEYESLVGELAALGGLTVKKVECVEHDGVRRLAVTSGRRVYRAKLRGDTDYIDEPSLLACLNEIATAAKKRNRYLVVRDERWGQETGIVFASAAETKRLRAAGFLPDEDEDEG